MKAGVERVNIKDISVEAPMFEPVLPFDPKVDFPKANWPRIRRTFKNSRFLLENSEIARDLKIVAPEKLKEFGITEPSRADIIPDRPTFGPANMPDSLRRTITNFSVAFPGYARRNFVEIDWGRNIGLDQRTRRLELLPDLLWEAIGAIPDLSKETIARSNPLISEELIFLFENAGVIRNKSTAASLLKILFPKDFDGLNIDESFWYLAKSVLSKSANYPREDLEFARDLTIIAAKEVRIDENGLTVIPYRREKSGDSDQNALPEVRRF